MGRSQQARPPHRTSGAGPPAASNGMRRRARPLLAVLLALALAGHERSNASARSSVPGSSEAGLPLRRGDVDAALERSLLERFAPLVLLAPGERALPANVDWFLARVRLDPDRRPGPLVTQASLLGDLGALLEGASRRAARLRPEPRARAGSGDPRDWVVYGRVKGARGGGLLVQYWFFYAYNECYVLFDHDGDWEHVTVRLDDRRRPLGAWYARHERSAPGRWFAWPELAREGDHPVVLSARGSHSSYARASEARFYDRVCRASSPARAEGEGCRVWRTWSAATGGIVATGSRDHPRPGAAFIAWPGLWGARGWLGLDSGGPPGPAQQAGWCAEAPEPCG
jgi:hypothetical protein